MRLPPWRIRNVRVPTRKLFSRGPPRPTLRHPGVYLFDEVSVLWIWRSPVFRKTLRRVFICRKKKNYLHPFVKVDLLLNSSLCGSSKNKPRVRSGGTPWNSQESQTSKTTSGNPKWTTDDRSQTYIYHGSPAERYKVSLGKEWYV